MNMQLRNVPFSPPDMTEAEANEVRDAILSGWITTGPRTKKLEKLIAQYVGVNDFSKLPNTPATPNCVCLNSQTACAEMALRLLGVGAGDEVIVPAYTYTASASIVDHVGAKIVFVDIQDSCLEMNYDKVEAAITERTKAIIPVDLAGIPCDYDRLKAIVEAKKDLFTPKTDLQKKIGRVAICADCAHSFGASRKGVMAGAIADFSSFSFHAVKNFTTAEGGALTWNLPFGKEIAEVELDKNPKNTYSCLPQIEGETWNSKLYRITQLLSLHGQNKDALAKTKLGAWEYDIVGPWFKCNMTDVVAAIGLIQFGRYPEMLEKRKNMIARYNEAFKHINVAVLNHYTEDCTSSGHLYLVRLLGRTREEANTIIEKMAERGIATNVHYKPLPMMTAYKKMGFDIANFPNAFKMFENEISLPLTTKMSEEDLEYVIENFVEIVKAL
ncbi:MAG: DegT/DnrJ/EryC1/StrS family aminotransferase [Paraprevotella sp.]|nr:DegT/DnrJ/EryC1/StrS family aminotransferase [Paraprevotella sp.]